jgi:hypothetical protein
MRAQRGTSTEVSPYRVGEVRASTAPSGESWTVTFVRLPEAEFVIDLTMNAVVFRGLDLDRSYAAGDLMSLREVGIVD